jgi:integrase
MLILNDVIELACRDHLDTHGKPLLEINPVSAFVSRKIPNLGGTEERTASFLESSQIRRWALAVESESESQTAKDFLFLLLFTGLPVRTAADLKWKDVDHDECCLKINGSWCVPLHPWLMKRFDRRQEIALGREFVFATKKDVPYNVPQTIKSRIQKTCGVAFDSNTISKTFGHVGATLGFDTKDLLKTEDIRLIMETIFRLLKFKP